MQSSSSVRKMQNTCKDAHQDLVAVKQEVGVEVPDNIYDLPGEHSVHVAPGTACDSSLWRERR